MRRAEERKEFRYDKTTKEKRRQEGETTEEKTKKCIKKKDSN